MEGLLDCIEKQIGVGGFGKVYLAQGEDGQQYALKRIENRPSQLDNIQREIEAGKRLTHKNITKFVGHFEDNGCTYLVFEYVKGTFFCISGY
jgi:NIMA (never in mitosis gene a)-related kinase